MRKKCLHGIAFLLGASVIILLAAGVASLLASCDHKPFAFAPDSSVRVRVIFDWSNAPGASATGMSVYFFPSSGGPLRRDFPREGGLTELPPGTYRVLCLNNDSESALLRGTDTPESFEACAPPLPVQDGDGQEPAVSSPGMLWGTGGTDFTVTVPSELPAPESPLVLCPEEQSYIYTVEIVNVRNLAGVSSAAFSLSGMSASLFPGTGRRSPSRSSLRFEAGIEEGTARLTGRVLCFGVSEAEDTSHRLTLSVALRDGSRRRISFDVSGQVNRATDRRHVHIRLDGLTIPAPAGEEGGGFQTGVDDWSTETRPIDL